ncbi:hypothetical protein [Streptomyces javensis]|uniref:Uncharacterized protein n=1 Tax=Streptomyces javensis TaxID=114698 RepID=A0ABS0R606_9ACTN|nr:hypothetical protein [Streptomyces javensis]MBI0312735.1 hypothetical protein [Streptomyces javensis]
MSTPDYDMAPNGTTATAPPPAATQSQASGAAATDSGSTPERTRRRRTASRKDDSHAGLLIPGGVLTGLISLCWMVHTFGLPVTIFAVVAAAATATAAMVIKASRRAARVASRQARAGRANGGAGPGSRGGGGGRSPQRGGGGRSSMGSWSGGTGPSRRGGGPSARQGAMPGALSRKPAGMGPTKSGGTVGPKNSPARLSPSRSGAGPKPHKGSLFGGSRPDSKAGAGASQGQSPRKNGGSGGLFNGKKNGSLGGLFNGGKNNTPGGLSNGKKGGQSGSGTGPGGRKAPNQKKNGTGGASASGKGAKAGKGAKFLPFRRPKALGGLGATGPKGKGSKGGKHGSKPKKKSTVGKARSRRHRRYTWRQPHLKIAAGVGRLYKKTTTKKFRRRAHKVTTPFRATWRGTRRYGGKALATAIRYGSRGLLSLHTMLGNVRSWSPGPNWIKPFSRVMHWATSPLAKLIQVSRTWTWLTTWIYKTAAGSPRPRPAAKATTPPTAGSGGAAPASPGGHSPVATPTAASIAKGSPVDNSPVHHAYPLISAAEAIRSAGQAFAGAPADSMKGYEAVIETLGYVNLSMFELMNRVATLTEEEFKVNRLIPEQYRVLSLHFLQLGGFIDAIHGMYRELHREQIDNFENPTWQGRKWDVSANWGSVVPMYASASPDVNSVPLLFAAASVRDAGILLQSNPAGSMFGYEQIIEHMPLLSEALHGLMETVAGVTESEFKVHEAVPAAYRDAGVRYRDLSGAIAGLHFLYRMLHEQQLANLENPTYQGAKWDQSRNT